MRAVAETEVVAEGQGVVHHLGDGVGGGRRRRRSHAPVVEGDDRKASIGQAGGHTEVPGERRLPAAADEDDRVALAAHLVVEREVGELEGGHRSAAQVIDSLGTTSSMNRRSVSSDGKSRSQRMRPRQPASR